VYLSAPEHATISELKHVNFSFDPEQLIFQVSSVLAVETRAANMLVLEGTAIFLPCITHPDEGDRDL
jgi:hypothetical protein